MRKVELGALDFQKAQYAAGSSLREIVNIKQGIDSDLGRKISKEIKSAKMKVQLAIQGNELRITGKKRDDLQEAIAFINGIVPGSEHHGSGLGVRLPVHQPLG